jgi:uncharacterized protein (TIGR03084 family)
MLPQAQHYGDECRALHALLLQLPDAQWTRPTQFKRWTANDVVGHLHIFDYAAGLTLASAAAVRDFFAQIIAGGAARLNLIQYTREWLGDCSGHSLLARWYDTSQQLALRFGNEDPARRVAWGGPDMSVRSCVSARQMETWSHGQALFDLMGRERVEDDRLRNIAIMGVNTFGWSFANRKLPVPEARPLVRLTAPSGALWEWNSAASVDQIEGSAVDFCRVVTQTRHVADTTLRISGPVAQQWMSMAQCFAGPPHEPPLPGTRFRQSGA